MLQEVTTGIAKANKIPFPLVKRSNNPGITDVKKQQKMVISCGSDPRF